MEESSEKQNEAIRKQKFEETVQEIDFFAKKRAEAQKNRLEYLRLAIQEENTASKSALLEANSAIKSQVQIMDEVINLLKKKLQSLELPSKKVEKVEFSLCGAIQNGLECNDKFPIAYIESSEALSISCIEEIQKFQDFAEIFGELCEKHGIPKLPGKDNYFSKKEIYLESKNTVMVKFTFNILPEDFDKLLMIESYAYAGYRNSTSAGGSILLLKYPDRNIYKEGVICLFPVLKLDEEHILTRAAGCNVTETISTQLTYFITQYMSPEIYGSLSKRYGHHGSAITRCINPGSEILLSTAIECMGKTDKRMTFQTMDGADIITLAEGREDWIKEMNPAAEYIYRVLGAAPPTELAELHSVEIPVKTFLIALKASTNKYLKNYEEGGDEAPGGKYYVEDHAEYYQASVQELHTVLNNLEMLIGNIETAERESRLKQGSMNGGNNHFFKPQSNTPCLTLSTVSSLETEEREITVKNPGSGFSPNNSISQ